MTERYICCRKLFFPMTKLSFSNLIFIYTIFYQFLCVFCPFSSYEKNGKVCYYCPPGFYWLKDCQRTGTHAQCMPCPDNHYQESQNIAHFCGQCTSCDAVVRNHNAAAILVNCTAFANTVCGCKPGYHFIEDYGGMGNGYCKVNSKCAAGSGAFKSASNSNSDTECESCRLGFTYNPSPTYEPCLTCTAACPNGSHINSPCNTTNNMECKPILDLSKPSIESIYPPNEHIPVLEIVLGTIISAIAIAIVVVCIVCMRRRCQHRSNERSSDLPVIFTNGVNLTGQRTNNPAEASNDIPLWISNCINDGNVDWEKIFSLCNEQRIAIARWELFIRKLFALSGKAETGEVVVQWTKEAYPQEKVRERIYQALKSWKEKCYSDKEHEMVKIFCKAYSDYCSKTLGNDHLT